MSIIFRVWSNALWTLHGAMLSISDMLILTTAMLVVSGIGGQGQSDAAVHCHRRWCREGRGGGPEERRGHLHLRNVNNVIMELPKGD